MDTLKQRARQRAYLARQNHTREENFMSTRLWHVNQNLSREVAKVDAARYRKENAEPKIVKAAVKSAEAKEFNRSHKAKGIAARSYVRRQRINKVARIISVVCWSVAIVFGLGADITAKNSMTELLDRYAWESKPEQVESNGVNISITFFNVSSYTSELAIIEKLSSLKVLITGRDELTWNSEKQIMTKHTVMDSLTLPTSADSITVAMPNPAYARFIDRLRAASLSEYDASISMYSAAMAREGGLSSEDFTNFISDQGVATTHKIEGIYGIEEVNQYYSKNLLELPVFGSKVMNNVTLATIISQLGSTELVSDGGPLLHVGAFKAYALLVQFRKFWSRDSANTVLLSSTIVRFERAKLTGDYTNFFLVVALRELFCKRDTVNIFGVGLTCVEINDLAQFFLDSSSLFRSEALASDGAISYVPISQVVSHGFYDTVTALEFNETFVHVPPILHDLVNLTYTYRLTRPKEYAAAIGAMDDQTSLNEFGRATPVIGNFPFRFKPSLAWSSEQSLMSENASLNPETMQIWFQQVHRPITITRSTSTAVGSTTSQTDTTSGLERWVPLLPRPLPFYPLDGSIMTERCLINLGPLYTDMALPVWLALGEPVIITTQQTDVTSTSNENYCDSAQVQAGVSATIEPVSGKTIESRLSATRYVRLQTTTTADVGRLVPWYTVEWTTEERTTLELEALLNELNGAVSVALALRGLCLVVAFSLAGVGAVGLLTLWMTPTYQSAAIKPLESLEEEVEFDVQTALKPLEERLDAAKVQHEAAKNVVKRKTEQLREEAKNIGHFVPKGHVATGISRKGSLYRVGDIGIELGNAWDIRADIEKRYEDAMYGEENSDDSDVDEEYVSDESKEDDDSPPDTPTPENSSPSAPTPDNSSPSTPTPDTSPPS